MSTKEQLRNNVKIIRKEINNKSELSKIITNNLLHSDLYKNANIVLVYSSINNEVETNSIIKDGLNNGKIVALPKCIDKNGKMDFYVINSFDDCINGNFGILEPNTDICNKLDIFDNSLIIVPALCFDKKGYRVGYGKGYYDRFLQNKSLISVGLCYNKLIVEKIPINEYDIPVNYIITEEKTINCNGGKNG